MDLGKRNETSHDSSPKGFIIFLGESVVKDSLRITVAVSEEGAHLPLWERRGLTWQAVEIVQCDSDEPFVQTGKNSDSPGRSFAIIKIHWWLLSLFQKASGTVAYAAPKRPKALSASAFVSAIQLLRSITLALPCRLFGILFSTLGTAGPYPLVVANGYKTFGPTQRPRTRKGIRHEQPVAPEKN